MTLNGMMPVLDCNVAWGTCVGNNLGDRNAGDRGCILKQRIASQAIILSMRVFHQKDAIPIPPWVRVSKGPHLGGPVEGWLVPTPYNNIRFDYYKDIIKLTIELSMIRHHQLG